MMTVEQKKHNKIIAIAFITMAAMIIFAGVNVSTAQENYVIQRGDTLTKIAKKIYGNARCWPVIASVPSNSIDFQGYIFFGKTLVLPPQSACHDIQKNVRIEMEPVEEQTIADVTKQPWYKKYLLIDDYIEGHYRDHSEYISIDRTEERGEITQNMFEWFNSYATGNGSYPMAAFAEASSLFDYGYGGDIDNRRYILRINDIPFTSDEQKRAESLAKRVARYINEEDKVRETIEFRDGSHWGMRVEPTNDRYDSSFFIIDGKKAETYASASRLTMFADGSWAFRYSKTVPVGCGESDPGGDEICSNNWFIKTSNKEYGPYENVSPPIPTVNKDVYFWSQEQDRYVL